MPISLDRADASVLELAQNIMREHHPELLLSDGEYPRLCILMATNSEIMQPAVKCHGYPCYAKISVIPYKQRVDKRADAEIIIDELQWNVLTDRQKLALLDHEITHLEKEIDGEGILKTDDCGRPTLRLKTHDYQIGGFRSIAKRYGDDALDVIEAKKFADSYGDDLLGIKSPETQQKEKESLPLFA